MFGLSPNANWIIILFIYAAIASMLPVWVLLQPRDYINGIQLIVGLVLLYGAVFVSLPAISAPAYNARMSEDAPSLVPLLFVTIACGAVSGFHGIVGSGTTSKQLDREPAARFIGNRGAVGEGARGVRRDEQRGRFVGQHIAQAGQVAGHHRQARSQGLEDLER